MPENNTLPMSALSEIPAPGDNAQSIIALKKEGGRITGYQLADGCILGKSDAIALARQGGILGVGISRRNGNEYLKSLPDGQEGNNLGSLPAVKQ